MISYLCYDICVTEFVLKSKMFITARRLLNAILCHQKNTATTTGPGAVNNLAQRICDSAIAIYSGDLARQVSLGATDRGSFVNGPEREVITTVVFNDVARLAIASAAHTANRNRILVAKTPALIH
jgi:hypothetical protein